MKMYFIALVLPPELNQVILQLKKWMQEGWGCKVGLKSLAHITLIPPFWMAEEKEVPLQQDIETLSRQFKPFAISTNNFNCFKPRTIFIEPVLTESLKKLKKETDQFFKTHTQYGAKIDNRPFHPHITIATRDLRKSAFAEAWPQLENKTFEQTFTATGISLLKHNGQVWDVVYTGAFGAG